MSWHLHGHRVAAAYLDRAEVVATCGEVLTGTRQDLSPTEPSTETRCPHCTWDTGPTPAGTLHPAAIRHHLNATRTAHREARRP